MTSIDTPDTSEESQDRMAYSMSGTMLFVAIRCTLQYVILPFVLPFLGISNLVSVVLSILIEVVALLVMGYNVIRLWNTNWRWGYLAWSSFMAFIIVVFLINDFRALLA